MTDFVDRLLGRSAVPAIRPLIPTLFEPVGPRQAEDSLPMGVFTTAALQSDDHPRKPVPHGPGPAVAPAADAVSGLSPASSPVGAQHESVLRVETHHHEHIAATAPGSLAIPAAPRVDSVPPVPPPAPLRCSHSAKAFAPQQIRAVAMPSTAPDDAMEPGLLVPAPIPARREGRHDPDVHISIGRVEITAQPAATRPQQRARTPRAPRLSLDAYLRDRGADVR